LDTFWTLFGQLTSENRRTFAPDFETNDLMTGVGLIGTAAAWLNLNKAKAEYEALKERYEAVQDAILANHQQTEYTPTIDTKPNNAPEGVDCVGMLRVANVVGKMFRCRASLIMTNTSKNRYYIQYAQIDTFFDGLPILIYKLDWDGLFPSGNHQVQQNILVGKYIEPGEVLVIDFPDGLSALPDEQMGKMRDLICAVAGKSLVTSIMHPVSIEDGIKVDYRFGWAKENEREQQDCYTLKKYGILRYMRELSTLSE